MKKFDQPAAFLDYIQDEMLRESLVADYKEMLTAFTNACWKAVHVLAGSIIETILIDYLLGENTDPTKETAILKKELAPAIDECKSGKILTEKTSQLCAVVKDYRNLIHPGRVKRLNEKVTEEGSQVAIALVKMVAADVSKKRKDTYGYTGEQILSKLKKDCNAFRNLMPSLAKQLKDKEKRRLLIELIPSENFQIRYEDIDGDSEGTNYRNTLIAGLKSLFIYLWNEASATAKTEIASRYYQLLHNADESERLCYEDAFVKCDFFNYLKTDELEVVVNHLV